MKYGITFKIKVQRCLELERLKEIEKDILGRNKKIQGKRVVAQDEDKAGG